MTPHPFTYEIVERFADTPVHDFVYRMANRPIPPPLAPKRPWDISIVASIKSIPVSAILGEKPLTDEDAAQSVKAGLLLWADALNASHEVCQDMDTVEGSYWHGIMHRREPDWDNAKHWFRKAGQHAIFPALREGALELMRFSADPSCKQLWTFLHERPTWDPFHMVDMCERVVDHHGSPEFGGHLEQIQALEIALLLDHCLKKATG